MSNQGNNGGWDPNDPHAQWQQQQWQQQQQWPQQQPQPQQQWQQPQQPQQQQWQQPPQPQQPQWQQQPQQPQGYDPNQYAQQQNAYQQPQQGYDPSQYAQQQNAYQQPQQGYDPNQYAQQGYPQQGYDPNQYAQQGYQQAQGAAYQQAGGYQAAMASGVPAYAGSFGPGGPAASGRPIAGADATVDSNARLSFIRLTYIHLFGAILFFSGVEFLLMRNETVIEHVSIPILRFALGSGGGGWNWAIFLLLFMVVGYIADRWAQSATSKTMQYIGLGLYATAEAVIFLPLLALAEYHGMRIAIENGGTEVHIIRDAAVLTLVLFGALTASVLITKKDFSFLRSGLMMATAGATGLVFLSLAGGFHLGLIFSIAMVILAAGYVLYYTSKVLAHYHPGQHVAASLALFSAIALMFWYVVRIMMEIYGNR